MIRNSLQIIFSAVITLFCSPSVQSKGTELRFQDLTIADGLSNNTVKCIMQDSRGFMWFGTPTGLNKYDGYSFTVYRNEPGEANATSCLDVLSMFEDNRGDIWVGTKSCGVYVYDREQDKVGRFVLGNDSILGLNSFNVRVILQDSTGRIWVGTENGLYVLRRETGEIAHYQHERRDSTSLSHTTIHSILQDRKNRLWIGTANGLNLFDQSTGRFRRYFYDPNKSDNTIQNIYEDETGNLWMGTYFGGVIRFNPTDGTHQRLVYDKRGENTISSDNVFSLTGDGQSHLYFGTENGGLNAFDLETGTFSYYTFKLEETGGITSNSIYSLYYSQDEILWIGTYGGLTFIDVKADTAKNYVYVDESKEIVRSVAALHEDSRDHLWVGTMDGLYLLDRKSQKFLHCPLDDKNLNNEIGGIVEDEEGNLWISNNHGLLKLEGAVQRPDHPGIVDLGTYSGIRKLCQSREGEIFFGGNSGLNAFFPRDITKNHHIPPIVITDFMIFGKEVGIDVSESPLRQHISETKEMILSHSQSVITFEFAALNYLFPEKNQYAYVLEGFDKAWNYSEKQRTATYTNLDPGDYVFRVKGANNDGVWNEEGAAIRIKIVPPWWRATWAYLLYILFTGLLLYSLWRFQLNRARMKHELALEHLHAKKLEELNRMKSRFFTNITHEFRTPPTLIMGQTKLGEGWNRI